MLKPVVENLINHTGLYQPSGENRPPRSRFVSSQHLNPPILSRTLGSQQISDASKQHSYEYIKMIIFRWFIPVVYVHQCLVEMHEDSEIHNKLFMGLDTQK